MEPSVAPSVKPSVTPTFLPSRKSTISPSRSPTKEPTAAPSVLTDLPPLPTEKTNNDGTPDFAIGFITAAAVVGLGVVTGLLYKYYPARKKRKRCTGMTTGQLGPPVLFGDPPLGADNYDDEVVNNTDCGPNAWEGHESEDGYRLGRGACAFTPAAPSPSPSVLSSDVEVSYESDIESDNLEQSIVSLSVEQESSTNNVLKSTEKEKENI
jgi:hypothetical protein